MMWLFQVNTSSPQPNKETAVAPKSAFTSLLEKMQTFVEDMKYDVWNDSRTAHLEMQ